MTAAEISHEYPLAKQLDSELWSENFALAMSDTTNEISMLYSIGTWYDDTSIWREKLSIQMPDGHILIGRNYGRNTGGSVVSGALSRYEIIEHEKQVRMQWNGPVWSHSFDELMTRGFNGGLARNLNLDVHFEATTPIWDMKKDGQKDKTGITGAMHTEQLGRCHGSLRYNGQNWAISKALSCRDHSRGKRDFAPYKTHCWINGEFENGRAFQLYAAEIYGLDGPALSSATVIEDGVHYPATITHVEFISGHDDYRKRQTIGLESAIGKMQIEVTRVRSCLPVSVVTPFEAQAGIIKDRDYGLIFDETVDLLWNGHTGLGWSERGWSKKLG